MEMSAKEIKLLETVANKLAMDCWFSVRYHKNGKPYAYDLENHKPISWRSALHDIIDGMTADDLTRMSAADIYTLLHMCV